MRRWTIPAPWRAPWRTVGRPSILKTRRFGYDGKGQSLIREGSDIAVGLPLARRPARDSGRFYSFRLRGLGGRGARSRRRFRRLGHRPEPHEQHILATTIVPADIGADLTARAFDKARKIADALDYVGVLAVEMFLVEGPAGRRLLVNEIAPRVHNSGHWTLDGSVTSQFEQHLRAICGFPLGSARAHGPVEMRNLIGADILRWRELLAQPGPACISTASRKRVRAARWAM